jgi:hypothetical protein
MNCPFSSAKRQGQPRTKVTYRFHPFSFLIHLSSSFLRQNPSFPDELRGSAPSWCGRREINFLASISGASRSITPEAPFRPAYATRRKTSPANYLAYS